MNNISRLPKDLQGKVLTQRLAVLDLDIHFGLWKKEDDRWLDISEITDFWYDIDVLKKSPISLEVGMNTNIIFRHDFFEFGSVQIHHTFEDMEPSNFNLTIKISNLGKLSVRRIDDEFVSGMVEIKSIKLQDVDLKKHFLDSTMIGIDSILVLPMSCPVYSWLVDNWRSILPNKHGLIYP